MYLVEDPFRYGKHLKIYAFNEERPAEEAFIAAMTVPKVCQNLVIYQQAFPEDHREWPPELFDILFRTCGSSLRHLDLGYSVMLRPFFSSATVTRRVYSDERLPPLLSDFNCRPYAEK